MKHFIEKLNKILLTEGLLDHNIDTFKSLVDVNIINRGDIKTLQHIILYPEKWNTWVDSIINKVKNSGSSRPTAGVITHNTKTQIENLTRLILDPNKNKLYYPGLQEDIVDFLIKMDVIIDKKQATKVIPTKADPRQRSAIPSSDFEDDDEKNIKTHKYNMNGHQVVTQDIKSVMCIRKGTQQVVPTPTTPEEKEKTMIVRKFKRTLTIDGVEYFQTNNYNKTPSGWLVRKGTPSEGRPSFDLDEGFDKFIHGLGTKMKGDGAKIIQLLNIGEDQAKELLTFDESAFEK